MIPAYPQLPITYPRDPRYVATAGVLRAARAEWFAACAEPLTNLDLWRARVDSRNRAYQDALLAVRAEEDRVLEGRAAEREYVRGATGAVARTGGRFAARKGAA